MFAALRSTWRLLIGLTPIMIVNIRKPGMYVRLVREAVEDVADPQRCGRGGVRWTTVKERRATTAADARCASCS